MSAMYFFIMGDKPQQCMSPGCSTVNRSRNKVFLLLLVQKNCEPKWHGSRLVIQEDRLFKSPSQIKKNQVKMPTETVWIRNCLFRSILWCSSILTKYYLKLRASLNLLLIDLANLMAGTTVWLRTDLKTSSRCNS